MIILATILSATILLCLCGLSWWAFLWELDCGRGIWGLVVTSASTAALFIAAFVVPCWIAGPR